jgi:NAD(P)-dependent dehydrogenase (short-subunit alcohol dehydrogenase family)
MQQVTRVQVTLPKMAIQNTIDITSANQDVLITLCFTHSVVILDTVIAFCTETAASTCAGKMEPERALSQILPDSIHLSFCTNAIGPTLVAQQFAPLLVAAKSQPGGEDPSQPAVIANMSAKVGSIGDNGFGGWYSYRCASSMHNISKKQIL